MRIIPACDGDDSEASSVTLISESWLGSTIIPGRRVKEGGRLYCPQVKKKSHDLAYLTILLMLTIGIILFTIIFVNSHIPRF